MSELFNHIEQPLWKLDERGKEITTSLHTIEHEKARKAALQHEMSCIALELWCRHNDGDIEFVQQ